MKFRALFVGLCLLLGGCDTAHDEEGFALTTDRSAYTAGETVALRLENRGISVAGSNLCSGLVEVVALGVERPVIYPNTACPARLHVLKPGVEVSARHYLRPGLPAGTYRAVITVGLGGDFDANLRVASNRFEVR